MSSLNTAYHHDINIIFHHYNIFLFKIWGGFVRVSFCLLFGWVFLNTRLFISFTQCWGLLTAHALLSEEMGFLLYYITYEPRNSKNPINKSDLLETFHGGHVLNLGYFLFAQQTTGILRVKLNETMELSQVSQPLISYTHRYLWKALHNNLIFLTAHLYLCCRM